MSPLSVSVERDSGRVPAHIYLRQLAQGRALCGRRAMTGKARRITAAIGCATALAVPAGSATAGNGYVNMPSRGCPGDFTPTSATAFPGFELSDINQDG